MSKLLNFKDIQTLRDKKISIVLRKFIKTKLGSQEQISEVTLSKYFEFIKNIVKKSNYFLVEVTRSAT
jgi:hypothetical protein